MTEDTVKIDKDILIETFKSGYGCKYSAAILQCEVGDSFLIPNEPIELAVSISRTAKRHGMRVVCRLAPPRPKTWQIGRQLRVWRTE